MKARLLVAAFVITAVAVAAIGSWLYAGTHPQFVPADGDVVVRERGSVLRSFPAESAQADEIIIWFQQHQTGWSMSFVSYAPKTTISCETFHINLLDGSIILNYLRHRPSVWMQITRTLTSEEKAFWSSFASRPPTA
jgi:hypothetical protein